MISKKTRGGLLKDRSASSRRSNLERQVAARTKELSALNAIAATVSQSLDLSEILDTALEQVLQVMEIDGGGIYLLDERSGTLNIKTQRGFTTDLVEKIDALQVGEGFSGPGGSDIADDPEQADQKNLHGLRKSE